MAWRARITRFIPEDTALRGKVEVGFYDDADPANSPTPTVFLHSRTYSTDELTTMAAFQQAIVTEGQTARASYNRTQAIKQQLPIGQEIAIP